MKYSTADFETAAPVMSERSHQSFHLAEPRGRPARTNERWCEGGRERAERRRGKKEARESYECP